MLQWGPFVHSLGIVQWDSTRRDHPGYPGRVSESGPVTHTCLSQIREKYRFQNKSFLFLKTHYLVSVNILDYPPRRIADHFSE